MKAIPKDKQIAVNAMISAPIDETNVQSDIIRRVFDNEECITRKGTYLGYVEDMAVKAYGCCNKISKQHKQVLRLVNSSAALIESYNNNNKIKIKAAA